MFEGFDANGLTGFFVMYGIVSFIAVVRAWGYPSKDALDRWMANHGLATESPSRSLVSTYLRRTRWIRTVGFLLGWNVPLAWLLVTRSARRMSGHMSGLPRAFGCPVTIGRLAQITADWPPGDGAFCVPCVSAGPIPVASLSPSAL